MESFEIKNLCTIHGKQGVFIFKRKLHNGIALSRLIDPDQTVVVFNKDQKKITKFEGVGIYIKDQEETTPLETVIEKLFEMEEALIGIPESLAQLETDQACTDTWPTVAKFMEEVLPNYDDEQFKPYHMDKILKWYKEISQALNQYDYELMDEADIMEAAIESNTDEDGEVEDPTTK